MYLEFQRITCLLSPVCTLVHLIIGLIRTVPNSTVFYTPDLGGYCMRCLGGKPARCLGSDASSSSGIQVLARGWGALSAVWGRAPPANGFFGYF